MEDNIVKKLLKVDFHIHSIFSEGKDHEKVLYNTIENIPILMKKLEDNQVDMIAITDHNNFSYDMYAELKKYENKTIKKVFPGVEFDVDLKDKRIHVVAIFNDEDDKKVRDIGSTISKYSFDNDKKNAFKEITFREILKLIDLDVIIIAHQKAGIFSNNQNTNLSNVGSEEYNKIIKVDYFDAVEFRNGDVEGILKTYYLENDLEEFKYITGSDCHNWNYYPNYDEKTKQQMTFSYLKCLPSFRGLVMSFTEPKRVTTTIYGLNKPYVDKIKISIDNKEHDINLSGGINVLIGDNSIGKSLLLETLIDNKYSTLNREVKIGYKDYLKKKKIKIEPFHESIKDKILYDKQGSIRETFQGDTKLLDVDYFNKRFLKLDTKDYLDEIMKYPKQLLRIIKYNQDIASLKSELDFEIEIPSEINQNTHHLSIVGIEDYEYENNDYSNIINYINKIIKNINNLLKEELLIKDDYDYYSITLKHLQDSLKKYNALKKEEDLKIKAVEIIKRICTARENIRIKISNSNDNKISKFKKDIKKASGNIKKYVRKLNQPKEELFADFEEIVIEPKVVSEGEYSFVTTTMVTNIDKKIMNEIIFSPFKKSSHKTICNLSTDSAIKNLLSKYQDTSKDFDTNYLSAISDYIDKNILNIKTKILKSNQDITTGNSQGKNAIYYLDTISNDRATKLYICDQPDDDISHLNLKNQGIDIFRKMSLNKQILFVTHKPELVVNLDVDNVIIVRENEDKIEIHNGALEFKNDDVNILNEVAEILDGGEETIRKRWKRYEKRNN